MPSLRSRTSFLVLSRSTVANRTPPVPNAHLVWSQPPALRFPQPRRGQGGLGDPTPSSLVQGVSAVTGPDARLQRPHPARASWDLLPCSLGRSGLMSDFLRAALTQSTVYCTAPGSRSARRGGTAAEMLCLERGMAQGSSTREGHTTGGDTTGVALGLPAGVNPVRVIQGTILWTEGGSAGPFLRNV